MMGHPQSQETRDKLRKAHLGKILSPEHRKKLSEAHKGKGRGRIVSEETREKLRLASMGHYVSPETRLKIGRASKDVFRTPEYRKKASERFRGDKSHWWRGGLTALHQNLRDLITSIYEYTQWRRAVFLRDNFTCQGCGIAGTYLEAHHIKHLQDILDEFNITSVEQGRLCEPLWDVNNGVTLCRECHNKTKGQGWKGGT